MIFLFFIEFFIANKTSIAINSPLKEFTEIPTLKLDDDAIKPISIGPSKQPASPASAKNENIFVPPFTPDEVVKLSIPGHKIPIASPAKTIPTTDNHFISSAIQISPANAHKEHIIKVLP